MTSLDTCISLLEGEANHDSAWLSFQPVFHEADSEYEIRGSRDGLLLFAAAAIKAGQGEDTRVNTSQLFTGASPDDQSVLYLARREGHRRPAEPEVSRMHKLVENLFSLLWAFVAFCAAVGLWVILKPLVKLTGYGV